MHVSVFYFAAYTCYGHWKNENTGVNYVISTPQGRSAPNSRRYCFIMSQVNGMAQQMLHIASVMESCHPHPLGRLHWAFNITHQGMINRERPRFLFWENSNNVRFCSTDLVPFHNVEWGKGESNDLKAWVIFPNPSTLLKNMMIPKIKNIPA